jgi:hypothetical protein
MKLLVRPRQVAQAIGPLRLLGAVLVPIVAAAAGVVFVVLTAGTGRTPGPDGPQRNVFEVYPPNGYFGGPAYLERTMDLGFPPLHNDSGQPVRLRSVQLVSPGPHARLLSSYAYLWAPSYAAQTTSGFGDLPKECPGEYVARSLRVAVTKARSDSPWSVMLVLRFTRPGTYRIWKVKLSYWVDGHPGWQYYPMYDIVHVQKGYGPHWSGCAAASG